MADRLIELTVHNTVRADEITRIWIASDEVFVTLRDGSVHGVDREYNETALKTLARIRAQAEAGGIGVNQLINIMDGVYVAPADVSAVMLDVHDHVCLILRGSDQSLRLRCDPDTPLESLARSITDQINAAITERQAGV
jgi:hypothetical protein